MVDNRGTSDNNLLCKPVSSDVIGGGVPTPRSDERVGRGACIYTPTLSKT